MAPSDAVEVSAIARGVTVRRAFIFVVDWRRAMLRSTMKEWRGDKTTSGSCLGVSLRAIADIMRENILADAGDQYGVVAFGTSDSASVSQWPRVRVIHEMSKLNADAITKVQRTARKAEELSVLDDDALDAELEALADHDLHCFGPDQPVLFDKVLWCARSQLHTLAAKNTQNSGIMYRLNIVVLTTDEDPSVDPEHPEATPRVYTNAFKQAKDLMDMRATIHVMLLGIASSEETIGSSDRFFDKLVQGGDEAPEVRDFSNRAERGVSTGNEIVDNFQRSTRSKRAVMRTTFTLGEGYTFGVAIYLLVSKKRRPNKIELDQGDHEPVRRVTQSICDSVGKPLQTDEIRYRYELPCLKSTAKKELIADDSLRSELPAVWGFTRQEVEDICGITPKGITLYGFKKRSALRPEYTMRAPYFVNPDEASYEGSKTLFIQLLDSMLRTGVIAIVRMSLRKGSPPRFAAMVPQEAVRHEDWKRRVPPGFHLHPLPYKNDLRFAWRKELESQPIKYEEGVPLGAEVAHRIVKGLTMANYHPDMFPNPDLARFYRRLATEAGLEDEDEEPSKLDPDLKLFETKRGESLREFKTVTMGEDFDGMDVAEAFGTKTGKRAREAKAKAEDKKVKREEDNLNTRENLDLELYERHFQDGTLNKLLVRDLKLYVDAHGLKAESKRKADLIAAIEEYMDKQDDDGNKVAKPKVEDEMVM